MNNKKRKHKNIPDSISICMKELIILFIYIIVIIVNISKLIITTNNKYFVPIAILLGYFTGDFFSGLYHYFMDTYDFPFLKELHKNFRKHHDDPLSMEKYPLSTSITEIMPVGIIMGILSSYTLTNYPLILLSSIIANLVMCSAQIAHRFAHRRTHEYDENGQKQFYIPDFIKFLQDTKIILNNKEHKKHHLTEVMNYCISNGNTSVILDKTIDIFDLPVSTYKNSDNIHKKQTNVEKYKIIDKYI
jgi:hypothetical protein